MAALSDSKIVEVRHGALRRIAVAASETIYKSALVGLDSSGNAIPADTSNIIAVMGIAQDEQDNSSGSAGDLHVTVEAGAAYKLVSSGLSAGTDEGKLVYVTDDQTVTTTPNAYPVGVITEVVSSTSCWVYIPAAPWLQDQTSGLLTSPRIKTSILDVNGKELMLLTATAAAVNEVTLANAATGNAPSITASGDDANVGLTVAGKGTGTVTIGQATGEVAIATATGDKVGFYGTSPTAQPGAATQTYATADATHAARTAPAAGGGSGADATTFSGAECDALVADQQDTAQLLNWVIDQLQALGLVQ